MKRKLKKIQIWNFNFLSSLIRENSNFIATSFQISLWNPRINTHLFSINSFILCHNLLSQHKSFGRWTIGEQKDKTDGTPIARTRTIPRTESPQWNPQTHKSNHIKELITENEIIHIRSMKGINTHKNGIPTKKLPADKCGRTRPRTA